jgi:hypothetical protein
MWSAANSVVLRLGCVSVLALSCADPDPGDRGTTERDDSAAMGAAGMSMTAGIGGAPSGGAGAQASAGSSAAGASGSGLSGSGGRGTGGLAGSTGGASGDDSAGGGGAAGGEVMNGVVWPNEMSKANSDPWLVENHDRITQLQPKVLVINLESVAHDEANALVDQHIAALEAASSFHGYDNPAAQPALAYELLKIVDADKGARIDYTAWNTQAFADQNIQIADPDDSSGRNLTLCELFERGIIHEVWCMASTNPKCGETQEAKQVYEPDGTQVSGRLVHVSNGDDITDLGCNVTARITDFNHSRGAGCHLHAMGHAWERYMDSNAVPMLADQAQRFLNWDLDRRVNAPFRNFYGACTSNGSRLTDCLVWESEIRVRSGPTASEPFDIPDMSDGCGNAHFYPNTTGTYSYDVDSPDPTVLTSCENYGLGNGPDGEDLKTPYNNAMTDMLYGRSQRTCPPDQPSCDDDCGGHGTTYLYQNFPGPGTQAKNEDGTPMQNWWVYLFY